MSIYEDADLPAAGPGNAADPRDDYGQGNENLGNAAAGEAGSDPAGQSDGNGAEVGYELEDERHGDEHHVDDMAGNRVEGATARAVLEYLAKALVDDPDGVVIEAEQRRGGLRLKLHVSPSDMGRVIGRRGRVAQAMRAVVRAAGSRDHIDATIDIVDE
ncbi:MAG: KH domain-containing protein [Actinobacteria bacterium]|nr:KH domain-containing protein [Actinomycetota bacterium]